MPNNARQHAVDVGGECICTVFHNFGTRDVIVQVYDNIAPFSQVEVDIRRPTEDTVELVFANPPTASRYRVVVACFATNHEPT